jgi:aminoglycoside phosphotransferase (APT) family kinase protein
MTDQTPTIHDAIAVVQRVLGADVVHIERFGQGMAHWVYDVRTSDGQALVVRMTRPTQRWMFDGALHWHGLLAPRGVPLPPLVHADLAQDGGFPTIIMERLPGTDLGLVYPALSGAQKHRLAHDIVRIQQIAQSLPLAHGFGFATSYDDPSLLPAWTDVITASLDRSQERIVSIGAVDARHVHRVRAQLRMVRDQLDTIEPRCFLDDTTTKNVIVHNGVLSGIVDVDMVCFGDPLFTVALTRMALLSLGWNTDYIDAWCQALNVTVDQQRLLNFYTAVFCVDFLSEQGQQFNKDKPIAVDANKVNLLLGILDRLLAAM